MRALVAGAGGFIGGHLVKRLLFEGYEVVAVDIKPPSEWFQLDSDAVNIQLDLRELSHCRTAVNGVGMVFNLAADMGGMGFIESHKADCMLSVLINTHLLMAARDEGVKRFFFASSACVYAAEHQMGFKGVSLEESYAYPAMPEDGYGWEKLFSERMCRHFTEDFGLETRVARFHNVYGPFGSWEGGREKAPAAICRKVAEAKLCGSHEIEIWGTGEQLRSFMWIGDCIEGIMRIMGDVFRDPVNLGSDEGVTINRLVSVVEHIAGVRLHRKYLLGAPKGVNGRNSNNSMMLLRYGWAPSTRLEDGMKTTYQWIEPQVGQK